MSWSVYDDEPDPSPDDWSLAPLSLPMMFGRVFLHSSAILSPYARALKEAAKSFERVVHVEKIEAHDENHGWFSIEWREDAYVKHHVKAPEEEDPRLVQLRKIRAMKNHGPRDEQFKHLGR